MRTAYTIVYRPTCLMRSTDKQISSPLALLNHPISPVWKPQDHSFVSCLSVKASWPWPDLETVSRTSRGNRIAFHSGVISSKSYTDGPMTSWPQNSMTVRLMLAIENLRTKFELRGLSLELLTDMDRQTRRHRATQPMRLPYGTTIEHS